MLRASEVAGCAIATRLDASPTTISKPVVQRGRLARPPSSPCTTYIILLLSAVKSIRASRNSHVVADIRRLVHPSHRPEALRQGVTALAKDRISREAYNAETWLEVACSVRILSRERSFGR